jgi:hypothetical protein
MLFNPENHIVKLCAAGMQLEGEGNPAGAAAQFQQAWGEANTALERFIAAHYLARHQTTTADKLYWDEMALEQALKVDNPEIKAMYPSLYLNIGKCYEDLADKTNALKNYQSGLHFVPFLQQDGYGEMIEAGIRNGIRRVIELRAD